MTKAFFEKTVITKENSELFLKAFSKEGREVIARSNEIRKKYARKKPSKRSAKDILRSIH